MFFKRVSGLAFGHSFLGGFFFLSYPKPAMDPFWKAANKRI